MKSFKLPFYSQFLDVKKRSWRVRSCGVVSLRAIMEYWNHRRKINPKGFPSIDKLYQQGLNRGAYLRGAGWKHAALAALAGRYGLKRSRNYDLVGLERSAAAKKLKQELKKGPVIVSVYKKYNIRYDGGHLPVLLSLDTKKAVLLDPNIRNRKRVKKIMPAERFLMGWKKRFIVIRP